MGEWKFSAPLEKITNLPGLGWTIIPSEISKGCGGLSLSIGGVAPFGFVMPNVTSSSLLSSWRKLTNEVSPPTRFSGWSSYKIAVNYEA